MSTPALAMRQQIVPRAPTNKWLVTISITFGTLMGAIDSSIVNVALPHIRGATFTIEESIAPISVPKVIEIVTSHLLVGALGTIC